MKHFDYGKRKQTVVFGWVLVSGVLICFLFIVCQNKQINGCMLI